MKPLIDPRRGDVEDDASSTKRRSLLSLAGSLLSEVSLPKLALAWRCCRCSVPPAPGFRRSLLPPG